MCYDYGRPRNNGVHFRLLQIKQTLQYQATNADKLQKIAFEIRRKTPKFSSRCKNSVCPYPKCCGCRENCLEKSFCEAFEIKIRTKDNVYEPRPWPKASF